MINKIYRMFSRNKQKKKNINTILITNRADLLYRKGIEYDRRKDYANMVECFEMCMINDKSGKYTFLTLLLGKYYSDNNNIENAIKYFTTGIAGFDQDIMSYYEKIHFMDLEELLIEAAIYLGNHSEIPRSIRYYEFAVKIYLTYINNPIKEFTKKQQIYRNKITEMIRDVTEKLIDYYDDDKDYDDFNHEEYQKFLKYKSILCISK